MAGFLDLTIILFNQVSYMNETNTRSKFIATHREWPVCYLKLVGEKNVNVSKLSISLDKMRKYAVLDCEAEAYRTNTCPCNIQYTETLELKQIKIFNTNCFIFLLKTSIYVLKQTKRNIGTPM